MSISPSSAIDRLVAGNQRFVASMNREKDTAQGTHFRDLSDGQNPFAVILGCSDSRVPAEIIFDQGLGDLFVIRVAGNIVAPSLIGSVEYAAEMLGTRLVVVLGHTGCGAVQATLNAIAQSSSIPSPNLSSIVERIRPAVETVVELSSGVDPDQLARRAVRANIRASVGHLRYSSRILEELAERDEIAIVGAEYSLETGNVEFLDGVSPKASP